MNCQDNGRNKKMRRWNQLNLNPIEWYFAVTSLLVLEVYALKKGQNRTLSRVVWKMRSDRIGKWLLISSWVWLTYHFFFEEG